MAGSQNKGLQFFVTMVVFLGLFFVLYFFVINKGNKKEAETAPYKVGYINDGDAYIAGEKGENPKKIAVAKTIAWAPLGTGCYYIDNYAKLKYYDIDKAQSQDVFISVASFVLSSDGGLIAVIERGDQGAVKVITKAGELVAELGTGSSPCWFHDGERLAYISGNTIYDAAGGDWNSFPLYKGKPTELAVSPDGKSIIFVEQDGNVSRLLFLDVTAKTTSVIKEESFETPSTPALPLGFSHVRFLPDKNQALFIYNDSKGGRLYSYDLQTKAVKGVSEETGPIYSLSVSTGGDFAAYFFIVRQDLPNFTEKKDGKEIPLVFGPAEMNRDYVAALYKRGDNKEIGGDKLNTYNTRTLLDGDVVRIINLRKGVFWTIGSGQYPVLR
jgi:hypothetical protein